MEFSVAFFCTNGTVHFHTNETTQKKTTISSFWPRQYPHFVSKTSNQHPQCYSSMKLRRTLEVRQLQCLEWHFTPSVGHLQGIARHGVIGIQGTALHGRLKADSGVLVWASRLVFQCSLLELRLQLSEDVLEGLAVDLANPCLRLCFHGCGAWLVLQECEFTEVVPALV